MVWTYPDDLEMYDTHKRVSEDDIKNRSTGGIDYIISDVQAELGALPEEDVQPPSLEWIELDNLVADLRGLPVEPE